MDNRKSIFWIGLLSLIIGLYSFVKGIVFDYVGNPNQSVRHIPPGITFLLLGGVLLFLYFKYKKNDNDENLKDDIF